MMLGKRWRMAAAGGFSLAGAGCAATPPPKLTDMEHPQHGIVAREHPAYTADVTVCAEPIYARGLVVNGRKVTDRATATAAYLGYLKQTYTYADTNGEAVAPKAASAPRRGASNLITSSTAPATPPEPAFVKDYFAYEKATQDCVREKGWTDMRG